MAFFWDPDSLPLQQLLFHFLHPGTCRASPVIGGDGQDNITNGRETFDKDLAHVGGYSSRCRDHDRVDEANQDDGSKTCHEPVDVTRGNYKFPFPGPGIAG